MKQPKEPLPKHLEKVNYRVYNEVGSLLRKEGVHDWRYFAEALGFSRQEIENYGSSFQFLTEWKTKSNSTVVRLLEVAKACGKEELRAIFAAHYEM